MTVEIRELVIQAKISMPEDTMAPAQAPDSGWERIREERLIQTITRRVLEQLRDEGWGPR
jgi:hypothetical protein